MSEAGVWIMSWAIAVVAAAKTKMDLENMLEKSGVGLGGLDVSAVVWGKTNECAGSDRLAGMRGGE